MNDAHESPASSEVSDPKASRVLVIDDHVFISEGIVSVLRRLQPAIVVATTDTCASGIARGLSEPWDFILLDLQLPDQSGFIALQTFKTNRPEIPVVITSAQEDHATVLKCLDAGAKGFIPKSSNSQRISEALGHLLDGGITVPRVMPQRSSAPNDPQSPNYVKLTDRQMEVLKLITDGLSNKLIGRKLDIAESTVKIHVSSIFRELQVNSRTQAMLAVARAGLQFKN